MQHKTTKEDDLSIDPRLKRAYKGMVINTESTYGTVNNQLQSTRGVTQGPAYQQLSGEEDAKPAEKKPSKTTPAATKQPVITQKPAEPKPSARVTKNSTFKPQPTEPFFPLGDFSVLLDQALQSTASPAPAKKS